SLLVLLGFFNSSVASAFLKILAPTMDFNQGPIGRIPFVFNGDRKKFVEDIVNELICYSKNDWDMCETSWEFSRFSFLFDLKNYSGISESWSKFDLECEKNVLQVQEREERNNKLFIESYGLEEEISDKVLQKQITLYRPNCAKDIKRLISYAIGCMMGRYSLAKPGLIYAYSGNKDFDPSQYQTFPADDDGIIPIMETDWFPDDASNRLAEFIIVAWPKAHLEENLTFIADSLGPNRNEQPRDTIRRYLATGFYKHHLQMYKRRPIYWLFSSGKQRAFQ